MTKEQNLIENDKKGKYVSVSAVGECILNYKALPPELDGWRRCRLEMGGHAQSCFMEQVIYFPPNGNDYIFDLLFDFWQANKGQRRKKLHDIVQELEASCVENNP